jgi:hypothetical protein
MPGRPRWRGLVDSRIEGLWSGLLWTRSSRCSPLASWSGSCWSLLPTPRRHERSASSARPFSCFQPTGLESLRVLVVRSEPEASFPGDRSGQRGARPHAAASAGKAKGRSALDNRAIVADTAETFFCAALSATTLAGVGRDALWDGGGPTRPQESSSLPSPFEKVWRPSAWRSVASLS